MWICKLEGEFYTNYRTKDLMELSVEEFEQKNERVQVSIK